MSLSSSVYGIGSKVFDYGSEGRGVVSRAGLEKTDDLSPSVGGPCNDRVDLVVIKIQERGDLARTGVGDEVVESR